MEDYKENLKTYIKEDIIYQEYLKNKNKNFSDFDKFCIQHCKDIEELLEENEKLKAEYGAKVQVERDLLKEENQKLKAELQLYQGALKREHEAIHRANDLEEVIYRIEKYIEKETRIYGLSMSKGLGIHFDNILGILKGGSNE